MSTFSEAYKSGLSAAAKAEAARKEIDEIFKDLRDQVYAETQNGVVVERRFYKTKPPLDDADLLSLALTSLGVTNPFFPQELVIAFNPQIGKDKEQKLAYWEMDRAGYPCKLEWGRQVNVCENKIGLINALVALLRDPMVASKIQRLSKPG